MKKSIVLMLTLAAVAASTAAHADGYVVTREGRAVMIDRITTATGKVPPQPSRTYIQDSNGNLRDPVTGWPKGRNY